MVRRKVIQARVSDEETELIEAYCAAIGKSISGLIRELVLEKAEKFRDERLQPVVEEEPTVIPSPRPEEPKQAEEEETQEDQSPQEPARVELSKLFNVPRN